MSERTRRLAGWRSPEGRARYVATYDAALSLWPTTYESRLIPNRFGTTHVVVSGPEDAPALVHAAAGIGAVQWYPNAAALGSQRRIYALDFVGGPGRGTQTRAILDRADCASWLTDVFDALQIERADVVGSSHGGWLALNVAVHAPDRVGGLVLLAPAASLLPFRRGVYWTIRLGPLMPAWTARPAMRAAFGRGYEVDELLVQLNALHLKHFRYQQDAVFPDVFSEEELRELQARTLILVGERELIDDPQAALDRARELIPHVETELVPDTRHVLNMERAELVSSRLLGFLRKEGADEVHREAEG